MDKERCAFYDTPESCFILTEKDCLNCSFYKTKEQLSEGREKARERIFNLCVEGDRPDLMKYLTLQEKYKIKKLKEIINNG